MSDKKKENGKNQSDQGENGEALPKPKLTNIAPGAVSPAIPDQIGPVKTESQPGTPPIGEALQALLGSNNELQNKVVFLTSRVEGLIAEKATLLRALDTITRLQAKIDIREQRDAAAAAQSASVTE